MNRFFISVLLLGLFVLPVRAQDAPPPVPDEKPPTIPLDESLEPQVTIIKREGATIEEYRISGRLFKIVVTPENAPPYTLIDRRGDGTFALMLPATPGSPQMSVPMWVIGTF